MKQNPIVSDRTEETRPPENQPTQVVSPEEAPLIGKDDRGPGEEEGEGESAGRRGTLSGRWGGGARAGRRESKGGGRHSEQKGRRGKRGWVEREGERVLGRGERESRRWGREVGREAGGREQARAVRERLHQLPIIGHYWWKGQSPEFSLLRQPGLLSI